MRTDAILLSVRLAELLSREHAAAADFLLALADFDARGLHRELGYASLFDYLHRELGLSRGAAHYRKIAARLVRAHPAVAEALRDGRLCITTVVELARVLTPANEAEVLPRFFHRSRREAREVAVELSPAPVVPARTMVTPVRPEPPEAARVQPVELDLAGSEVSAAAPPSAGRPVVPTGQPMALDAHPSPGLEQVPTLSLNRPPPVDDAIPLTADRSRLHVTVSRRFLAKLEAARAARSHARPEATVEELLEEALDLLLAREAARREGAITRRPPPARASSPDHVPAAVRREVWARDAGRCQWPLASGGTCGSTRRLELDHVVPRALGGPSTPGNLRVLCQVHNLEAARRALGAEAVGRYARRRTDAKYVSTLGTRRHVDEVGRMPALNGSRNPEAT